MSLTKWRTAALRLIAALVAMASLAAFAESYRGLWLWSREHGLPGVWSAIWPLQLDVFIAIGELTLFVGLVDAWSRRSRSGAWAVTLIGAAVSVAGNVGHVAGHDIAARLTAAAPPIAAAASLAVALGILKRVTAARQEPAMVAAAEVDIQPDSREAAMVTVPVPQPPQNGHKTPPKRADKLTRLLSSSPDMPVADMARKAGVSERTVARRKAAMRDAVPLTSLGDREAAMVGAVNGTAMEGSGNA